MTGNTSFGGGDNQLKLSGDAAYAGDASFGAGDDSFAMAGSSTFNGVADFGGGSDTLTRSEEHTSELQSLMRISYAVFCLNKKKDHKRHLRITHTQHPTPLHHTH